MPCEQYKDALAEVAAAGAAPQGELRTHLDDCAPCRVAFDKEQSLFAGIDSGLHAAANVEVPPSFLPRVRARLDEIVVPRFRWLQPFAYASASLALVLLVFLMARPRRATPENSAKAGPVVVPAPVTSRIDANSGRISLESTQIVAARVNHSHSVRNSTNVHSAASSSPEVLVPPDEREGLAQLVAKLSEHRDVAAALLAQRTEEKDALVTVDPLKIPDIEIKPLEGAETETSDGPGEKH